MCKVGLVLLVQLLTSLFHTLCHPRRATAEHANLVHLGRRDQKGQQQFSPSPAAHGHGPEVITSLSSYSSVGVYALPALLLHHPGFQGLGERLGLGISLSLLLAFGCPHPVPRQLCGLTSGCTSCSESKKGTNGGRPKWVMERSPVNRLLFSTFWKCRSQMYCKRDPCLSDRPQSMASAPQLLSAWDSPAWWCAGRTSQPAV